MSCLFLQHILKRIVTILMEYKKTIILFDGICKLCNGSVNFIRKRDKKKQFNFVALQSEEGNALVKQLRISKETDSIILLQNKQIFIESDAAIEIGKRLPGPWKWVFIFKIIPKSWRDKLYCWVANNRYRWCGKQKTICHFEKETIEKSIPSELDDTDFSLRSK